MKHPLLINQPARVNTIVRKEHAQSKGPSLSHPARTNPLGNCQNAVSIVSSGFWGRTRTNLRAASLRMVEQQASWGSAYAAPIFINLALAGIYVPICCWIRSHDVRMYACSYGYLKGLNPLSRSAFAALTVSILGMLLTSRKDVLFVLRWLAVINRWNKLAKRLGVPARIVRISYEKRFPK